MNFDIIIGLEIHVELSTDSKIFCSCSTNFGDEVNENTCPICMGFPGTLPTLNEKVLDLAVKTGKALNCDINELNEFDRKNYFYPDLPKAYQISQFDIPICEDGFIDLKERGIDKKVRIRRIHIEEDAGKLIHDKYEPISKIDYNRTGVPLIEIVTRPDIRSPKEAIMFLKELKLILEYIGVSDCKMEEGSLRCDANISLKDKSQKELNTKVEIKNMNSFKEIKSALEKEIKRQEELYRYDEGHKIKQETRKWDSGKGKTVLMRTKENADDYRYFKEPDLDTVRLDEKNIENIEKTIEELPNEKRIRFLKDYKIKREFIDILIDSKNIANFFEEILKQDIKPEDAANWIIVELLSFVERKEKINEIITPKKLATIISMVNENKISRGAGKKILEIISKKKEKADIMKIIKENNLMQMNKEGELKEIISKILKDNNEAIEDYKAGEERSLDYLVGQVMKETRGKANPVKSKDIILELI